MDKISISVFGESFFICRAASIPFNSGMLISMTAISGRNSLAIVTASRPLCASAHTLHPGCDSKIVFSPRRTRSWSSAIMIRNVPIFLTFHSRFGFLIVGTINPVLVSPQPKYIRRPFKLDQNVPACFSFAHMVPDIQYSLYFQKYLQCCLHCSRHVG